MLILAIDTSCDETSVAISENDRILANVISSQVELHKKWGGVVPTIAERAHRERIESAIKEACQRAGRRLDEIDVFAATVGPGLAIALAVGIEKIQELSASYQKPSVAVNHMVGHIYANLAKNKAGKAPLEQIEYPALALLVSGGHTELILMSQPHHYEVIGQTLDDALGEAFDKVARMLDLGYPGGPIVARLAEEGNPNAYDLPIPMSQSKDLNFSFSGLKTAVLYTIKRLTNDGQRPLEKQEIIDLAASFQRVAFAAIELKTIAAIKQYQPKQLLLGGGVVANLQLRKTLRKVVKEYQLPIYYPNLKKLCTDNAAMIAVAAYHQAEAGDYLASPDQLDRQPNLKIGSNTIRTQSVK